MPRRTGTNRAAVAAHFITGPDPALEPAAFGVIVWLTDLTAHRGGDQGRLRRAATSHPLSASRGSSRAPPRPTTG